MTAPIPPPNTIFPNIPAPTLDIAVPSALSSRDSAVQLICRSFEDFLTTTCFPASVWNYFHENIIEILYTDASALKNPMMEAIGFLTAFEIRSEEHTSELQSRGHLICRLLLEKK